MLAMLASKHGNCYKYSDYIRDIIQKHNIIIIKMKKKNLEENEQPRVKKKPTMQTRSQTLAKTIQKKTKPS